MSIEKLAGLTVTVLFSSWPTQGLAADCEYEPWNVLQANKDNATAMSAITAPPWVREPEFRGTFAILETCLLTLTACVYTALHLNVPSERDRSTAGALWLKARWVIMAVLVPEVILERLE